MGRRMSTTAAQHHNQSQEWGEIQIMEPVPPSFTVLFLEKRTRDLQNDLVYVWKGKRRPKDSNVRNYEENKRER